MAFYLAYSDDIKQSTRDYGKLHRIGNKKREWKDGSRSGKMWFLVSHPLLLSNPPDQTKKSRRGSKQERKFTWKRGSSCDVTPPKFV